MNVFRKCLESLGPEELEELRERGFIAFEEALSLDEAAEAAAALSAAARRIIEDPAAGVLEPRTAAGNQSGRTLRSANGRTTVQFEAAAADPGTARVYTAEIEAAIRKLMWFEDEAPILRSIYRDHRRIRGVVESVLGKDAVLYQSMALIKPANIGSEKPWHQDNAYFSIRDLDGILGTWIALDDATVENGCMHFLEGGHKAGPLKHYHGKDCEIVPGRFDPARAVPVELPSGGMVIFHGNLPHFTPPNRSRFRRRALQYHYRAASNEVIPAEAYNEIFKERDGTPASCAAARPEAF